MQDYYMVTYFLLQLLSLLYQNIISQNNFCYIILTKNDGLVYKRVFTGNLEHGYLTLSSDNKAYQPYQIHVAEIMEIWQFKLNLCIGQYDEDELNPSNILNLMRSVGIELKDLSQRVSKLEVN